MLAHLARHAGRVVTREDLLAAAWPGLHVAEEVLANAVYQLRRALGDTARDPRYIETIPRRGYRLLAPVAPARQGSVARRLLPPPLRAAVALTAGAIAVALAGYALDLRPGGAGAEELAARGSRALDAARPGAAAQATAWAEQALDADPACVDAWALAAAAWGQRAAAGEVPAATGYPRARDAAERALARDPDDPRALTARALARWLGAWDWDGAEADLRRAVAARAPGAAGAHALYAELLAFSGRLPQARDQASRSVRRAPGSVRSRLTLAMVAQLAGDREGAKGQYRDLLADHPGHPAARHQLAKLDAPAGGAARRGVEGLAGKERLRPAHLALFYAESGKADRALHWLERAVRDHDPTVLFFRFDPRWDALRSHPRYRRAMRGAGIPS